MVKIERFNFNLVGKAGNKLFIMYLQMELRFIPISFKSV